MASFSLLCRGYTACMWRLWIAFICLGIAAVLVYVLIMGGLPFGGGSSGGGVGGGAPAVGAGGGALVGSLSGGLSGGGGQSAYGSPSPGASARALNESEGSITGAAPPDQKMTATKAMSSTPGFVQPTAFVAPPPVPITPPGMSGATVGVPAYAAPTFAPIGTSGQNASQAKPTAPPTPRPSPTPPAATSAPTPQSSVFPTWTPYASATGTPH